MTSTMHVPTPVEPSSTKALKIVGLVLLGAVALCGLAGTCVLLVTFVLPLVSR